MSEIKDRLIESAIGLVRVKGYAGFSYADLSEAVGIRKPSIHHHFPTKEDLGEVIVAAYSDAFFERLDAIQRGSGSARDKIKAYAEIYREAFKAGHGCLCGVLASEVSTLPLAVKDRVARFFRHNERWLESVLAAAGKGKAGKRSPAEIHAAALLILGGLQGGLFIARTLESARALDDAIKAILEKVEDMS